MRVNGDLPLLLIALAALFLSTDAYAHKPADSYLRLRVEGNSIDGEWDIALADLEATAKLQTYSDRQAIKEFALQHIVISADSAPCALHSDEMAVEISSNAPAPVIRFKGECPAKITSLTIDYSPLLTIDVQYRGLIFVKAGGIDYTTALSAENPYFPFQLGAANGWQQFRDYLREVHFPYLDRL